MSGDMPGIIEIVNARRPSGDCITAGQHTIARMIGISTGKTRPCASCTVLTDAPIVAYSDE